MAQSTVRTNNRVRALDAAVELLATGGVRALTHRRIDALANLPQGSTSNYFRSRAALFEGVLTEVLSSELPEVNQSAVPRSAEELTASLVHMYEFLIGPNHKMTAARLALAGEANCDETLQSLLLPERRAFEDRLSRDLTAIGSPDPETLAQVFVALFDGMLLHQVGLHGGTEHRDMIQRIMRSVA